MNLCASLFQIFLITFLNTYSAYSLVLNQSLTINNDTGESWFTEHLIDLLYREDFRELFPYIYPFFIAEEDMFLYLSDNNKNLPEWIVKQTLYNIINNNFPNGIPSEKTLKLMENLLISSANSQLISDKFTEMLKFKKQEIEDINNNKNIFFSMPDYQNEISELDALNERIKLYHWQWINNDIKTISQQLSFINYQLTKLISVKNLVNWLDNPGRDKVIMQIIKEETNLANHFAYMILRQHNHDERINNMQKLCEVIKTLESMKNYGGIRIVLEAITKNHVSRLFKDEVLCLDIINQYGEFFANNNYNLNTEELVIQSKRYKNTIKPNKIILGEDNITAKPNTKSYWHNVFVGNNNDIYLPSIKTTLAKLHELLTNKKDMDINKIITIGKLVKHLYANKNQSYYIIEDKEQYHNGFFSKITITDDILIEYSNIYKPWSNHNKREEPEQNITRWSTMDLFSYLENHKSKEKALQFLNAGIWDGPSYLAHKQRLNELDNI